MAKGILEQLKQGVVMGDGGYVEEARSRGYGTPRMVAEFPNVLRMLHQDFFRAGAHVLQAQTGWATRSHLEQRMGKGWGGRVEEVNRKAVGLAREVAGDEALVAGCVWPSGVFNPDDAGSRDRARSEWEEQVAVMKGAGVDLLICESFRRLDEARLALACCKRVSIPTMVTVGLGWKEQTTPDGASPAECARALVGDGADIVGSNGAREPEDMLPLALEMREAVDAPICYQPSGFRVSWPGWEEVRESMFIPGFEMISYALQAKMHGIDYIGGDEGAGPELIRAVAQALGCERYRVNLHPR